MAEAASRPGEPPPLAVEVYANGGGYAFNVEANIDQTNASVGNGARLSGQKVIRYLREGTRRRRRQARDNRRDQVGVRLGLGV